MRVIVFASLLVIALSPFLVYSETDELEQSLSEKDWKEVLAELNGTSPDAVTNETASREERTLLKLKSKIYLLVKLGLEKLLKVVLLGHPDPNPVTPTPTLTTTTTTTEQITRDPDPAKPFTTEQTTTMPTTTDPPSNDTAKECYNESFLIIALDSSGSVGSNYRNELAFASKVAVAWKANDRNRIAVLLFSSHTQSLFGLEESYRYSASEIENRILSAPFHGLGTQLHLALDAAATEFVKINGTYSNTIPRKFLIITDGQSQQMHLTQEAATRLHKIPGMMSFSLGVGPLINYNELLTVTNGKIENVFLTNNFDSLLQALRPVTVAVCEK